MGTMNIDINEIEDATRCPYRMQLRESNTPIKFEYEGFTTRASHALDIYYARRTVGKPPSKTNLKAMFAAHQDEYYENGGDLNWKEAEEILFDRFVSCYFKLADPSAEVMPRTPVELPLSYSHMATGCVDAIVETQRRPRKLDVILYTNAPVHPAGNSSKYNFKLMFYKLALSHLYNSDNIKKARFIVYSFAPPAIYIVPFKQVDASLFKDTAGRITTLKELGLCHPCPGSHCKSCHYSRQCHYYLGSSGQ